MDKYLFLLLLFLSVESFAQLTAPSRYYIRFKDKQNSQYSLAKPHEFLTDKAIKRRVKMNIPFQENDLPVNPQYLDSLRSSGDVKILHTSRWFNSAIIRTTDSLALDQIKRFSFVKNITASGKRDDVEEVQEPPDKLPDYIPEVRKMGYNSVLDYGDSYTQINMIACDFLHENNFTGEGITIAVLDAGFAGVDEMQAFDHLRQKNKIYGTRDFVLGGTNVYHSHSHGTSVLSVMAAWLPGKIIGTAPHASYWLFLTEEGGSEYLVEEDNWIAAAEFADSVGVDIINSSLGYTTFDDPAQNHTFSDMNGDKNRISIGADIAASKGMLVVNSAGNWGSASYWRTVGAPADGDSVLTIGAVNEVGIRAEFSSTGPTADGRIKPDVSAMGELTVIASSDGETFEGSGTSFSAPIISGAAACLWQSAYAKSNMNIYEAIVKSASQYESPDTLLGYGIPDFFKAYTLLREQVGEKVGNDSVAFFPNPFRSEFSAIYYATEPTMLDLSIFDSQGKKIYHSSKEVIYGRNNLSLSIPEINGLYIINLVNEKGIKNQKKIIKLSD